MTNPEIDQDRTGNVCELFAKYGYVMFPQQRRIYTQIAMRLEGEVLEAGCGDGVGSAILQRTTGTFTATDKLEKNIRFASQLYPWIDFRLWDIQNPWALPSPLHKYDTVVAVEVLEHVADPQAAIANLIGAAKKEVWISTPNGKGKPRPPDNPFHVCEYTPREIMKMFVSLDIAAVKILAWDDFRQLDLDTDVDPLVYRVAIPQ